MSVTPSSPQLKPEVERERAAEREGSCLSITFCISHRAGKKGLAGRESSLPASK